jgi:RNA 3'-terminal phosphate cyclase (ATP)
MPSLLDIDGSQGEGGGQILRTSLALSLITQTPFRIHNIRANRDKPGLRQQHLTAVKSAAQVGQAEVTGAAVGSRELVFCPGPIRPGEYHFDIGTAGSATLVLQTVLPPLLAAGGPSKLTLQGGTHNIHAPPFDFLARAFLPLLNRIGHTVIAHLDRPGFYPAGGGQISVSIQPAPREQLSRLELVERGEIRRRRVRAVVARLPRHIAERELRTVGRELEWDEKFLEVEEWTNSRGPGNIVLIEIESDCLTELFTGFGERGVRAEAVAEAAACEARDYLESGVPIGPHLADQVLLPLALARGGRYVVAEPTLHTTTNIDVIRRFLPCQIRLEALGRDAWQVAIDE